MPKKENKEKTKPVWYSYFKSLTNSWRTESNNTDDKSKETQQCKKDSNGACIPIIKGRICTDHGAPNKINCFGFCQENTCMFYAKAPSDSPAPVPEKMTPCINGKAELTPTDQEKEGSCPPKDEGLCKRLQPFISDDQFDNCMEPQKCGELDS